MCTAFDNASRAYSNHDGAAAKAYADEGHEYQAERDNLNAEVRELIGENKAAKSSAGAYDYEVQQAKEAHSRARDRYTSAKEEFHRLKDRQDRAKAEQKRAADNFRSAKNSFQQAKDDLDAFKAKQHKDKRIRQEQKEAIAAKAGIPRQYWRDLVVKKDRNGNVNIYFGGSGSGDGTGHGHVSLNSSGRVTYTRMPFEPHGAQNFTDYSQRPIYDTDSFENDIYESRERPDKTEGKVDIFYNGTDDPNKKPHAHVVVNRDGQIIYWRTREQDHDTEWLINEDAGKAKGGGEPKFRGDHTNI